MSRAVASIDVFHAVADPQRRALLDRLAQDDEAAVGELVEHTGLSYSAVSQHLAVLLAVGLVHRREAGRQRFYRLDADPLRVVHDWTRHYERFWRGRLARLRRVLDERGER